MANEIELNPEIKKLIETSDLPSQDDLKQIIKDLLMYMKHEEMSTDEGLGHEPIFNSDFPGDDDPSSLFKRINWRADLDAGEEGKLDFDALLGNDTALGNNGIWNESVKELIKYFKNNFVKLVTDNTPYGPSITVSEKNDDGTKKEGGKSKSFYIIRNILKANAGNYFKMEEDESGDINKWTLPHVNIDGDSYGEVRGNDKILEVLESCKNLDFTHTQTLENPTSLENDDSPITKYIRLLMPKYIRRVEVEDLNRNFWVIGLVLSIVCAALFDDDSPIPKMLKQLSSETLLLWENVLYLWAAVNLLNEKKGEAPEPEEITTVHYEVIDYPRAVDKPYRDINAFNEVPVFNIDNNTGEILSDENGNSTPAKLKGYRKTYPDSNLCLLLRCRFGNYEKDYYHTEVYPYVVFYNINEDKWYATELKTHMLGGTVYLFGFTLRIDSDTYKPPKDGGQTSSDKPYDYVNLRNRVYCLTETSPVNYRLYYPLSKMPPNDTYTHPDKTSWVDSPTDARQESVKHYYYGMVRIKPSLSIPSDKKLYNNHKILIELSFEITDIARKLNFYLAYDNTHTALAGNQDGHYSDANSTEREYYNWDCKFEDTNKTCIKLGETYCYLTNPTTENKISPYTTLTDSAIYCKFVENIRDSGFQGSLCDMITYRGVSKTPGT